MDVYSSAEPLTPDIFKKLIHPLGRCRHLTKLSLFGNERLGNHTAVLSEFLSQIGRRCEVGLCLPPLF